MMHRARWIYPALVCVLIALYFAIPSARVAIVAVVGVLAAGAIGWASLTRRPVRKIAWMLVAVGVLLIAAGEVSYNVFAVGGHIDTFPSGSDWLYFAAYTPAAVGFLWLGLPRAPSRDWPAIIETAAASLAGSLIIWIMLVLPTMKSMHLNEYGKIVLIAGWVGDVVILVSALRLIMVWPRNASAWLLSVSVVALFCGDIRYGYQLLHGTWSSGGQVDAAILAFFALAGMAALLPSMTSIGSLRATAHRVAFGGLAMLALALLVAPTVLLAATSPGPITTPIGVVGAMVGVLVIVRLWIAMAAHRRTIARDVVVRQATRNLGLALNASDVTASLDSALIALATQPVTAVQVVAGGVGNGLDLDGAQLRVLVPAGFDELIDTGAGRARSIVYEAAPADLSELEDILVGLADQASIALTRIDLAERVRASEKEQNVLAYRASHDGLTGLANAELFRGELRTASQTTELGRITAVLFIDLDDFKNINDTLGHEAGDAVLVATAKRIRACLRHADLGARLGGDEFAVLLREIGDDAAAYVVARRLTDALAQPTMIGGIPVVCRASVGLAIAAAPHQYDALLRKADTALYAAKAAGKGRWRPYDPEMQSPLRRSGDLRVELERALRHGPTASPAVTNGLTMHYQPIVELANNRVCGFEALIRWQHPDRGTIKVPELIALAEHTGLILPLGEWVFARAFADGELLTKDQDCYISINVSVAQLRLTGFIDRLHEQLGASAIDPGCVVIEITESQLVQDDERIWGDLAELRTSGVRVAIDDYGTGYASLSYLRHPVIDIVKLDRRFLDNIGGERSRALLRAVLGLTGDLGLPLVAEGIEDEMTRRALVDLGCAYGQGHLFAAAMPLDDALGWHRAARTAT